MATEKSDPILEVAQTLSRLKANLPQLSDTQRRAYASQVSDAQRAEYGARTKAKNVLKEAVSMAVEVNSTMNEHASVAKHYNPARLAFFIENIQALADTLQREQSRSGGTTGKRKEAGTARTEALTARDDLVHDLEAFAGKRQDLVDRIAAATGTAETTEALAKGLRDLADLVEELIEEPNETDQVLLGDSGLDESRSQTARAKADALSSKASDALLEGRLSGTDSPETNVVEGGVLFEMEVAIRQLKKVKQTDPAVEVPKPGPGTRAVLGRHPSKAAKSDEEKKKASDKGSAGEQKPSDKTDKSK